MDKQKDNKEEKTLDARGLLCPMPSVKTALAFEKMAQGEVLCVITDDPVSKTDLPRWAESTGNEVLSIEGAAEEGGNEDAEAGEVRIYLKKTGP